MGAGQSAASQVPPRGLHVLRVTPLSPASETSIEPFFDFVIGFQGDTANSSNVGKLDVAELEKIVERFEGRPLNLLVWSSKNQNTRGVYSSFLSAGFTHQSISGSYHPVTRMVYAAHRVCGSTRARS